MQLPDAGQTLGQPPRCQPRAGLIHHIDVVMLFGPLVADKDIIDHRPFLDSVLAHPVSSPRTPGGDLMDQCSKRHDIR